MTKTIIYRDVIYEERIPFPGFIWLALLMTGLAALFLGFLVYSLVRPENLVDNTPFWYWLIMFAVFGFMSWLVFNFRELVVSITSEGVEARYGQFQQFQPWLNIRDVEIINKPGLRYGGWGIRLTRPEGQTKIVYNIFSAPVVVVILKDGKYAKFGFSSRKPQEVTRIIQSQIR